MIIYQYECPECGKCKLFGGSRPSEPYVWCPYCEKRTPAFRWVYRGMSERV